MADLLPEDPVGVGGYRLLRRLGAGGMGRVYLGRSVGGRTVAVKLVKPELAAEPAFRTRFRMEVGAARRVGARWTAPVLDADTEAETPWVATGYIAGPSLDQVVSKGLKDGSERPTQSAIQRGHGPLPPGSVRVLAYGLASALLDIHGAGIVHRDLKPSNVLLTIDGPRVIDFGIARALDEVPESTLTSTGMVVGSPSFMSPEQITGGRLSPASDVFCMGAVLAYAATGRPPFGPGGGAGGVHAVMYRIASEEPDLRGLADGAGHAGAGGGVGAGLGGNGGNAGNARAAENAVRMRELIADCLAKDPAARPTPEEIVARVQPVAVGASAPPWLPAGLLAELGREAVRLLDTETPPSGSGVHRDGAAGVPYAPSPYESASARAPAPSSTPFSSSLPESMPSHGAPSPVAGANAFDAAPSPGAFGYPSAPGAPGPGAATPAPGTLDAGDAVTPPGDAARGGAAPPPGAGTDREGTPGRDLSDAAGATTARGTAAGTATGTGSAGTGRAASGTGLGAVDGIGSAAAPGPEHQDGDAESAAPASTLPRGRRRGPKRRVLRTVTAVVAAVVLVGTGVAAVEGGLGQLVGDGGGDQGGGGGGGGEAQSDVPDAYLGTWVGAVERDGTPDGQRRRFVITPGKEGEIVATSVSLGQDYECKSDAKLTTAPSQGGAAQDGGSSGARDGMRLDTKVVKSVPRGRCAAIGVHRLTAGPDGSLQWRAAGRTATLHKVATPERLPDALVGTWRRQLAGGGSQTLAVGADDAVGQGLRMVSDGPEHCEATVDVFFTGDDTEPARVAPPEVDRSASRGTCAAGASSTLRAEKGALLREFPNGATLRYQRAE